MKIGITFSAFDLLHAGHIKMLEDAKRQCDFLICGLQTDPTLDRPEKNKPVQTVVERYIQLKGLNLSMKYCLMLLNKIWKMYYVLLKLMCVL